MEISTLSAQSNLVYGVFLALLFYLNILHHNNDMHSDVCKFSKICPEWRTLDQWKSHFFQIKYLPELHRNQHCLGFLTSSRVQTSAFGKHVFCAASKSFFPELTADDWNWYFSWCHQMAQADPDGWMALKSNSPETSFSDALWEGIWKPRESC